MRERWSPAGAERPWTLGIEEEVLLLDPRDWSAADAIDDVLAMLAPHVAAETHACVAELRTDPHATVAAAAEELGRLRATLEDTLSRQLALRAAVAGTHPLLSGGDVTTSSSTRYREIDATMRALAHREPTLAQHVHVAVPSAQIAVRVLDGLRPVLPVLLALSANSPFWRGEDSGFASIRTPIFGSFPRTGIARHFGDFSSYAHTVDQLLDGELIPDPQFLWWDARLQPRFGTVEVRVMDAQSRVADAAALAAVVQCLVRRCARREDRCAAVPEVLAENRFLAARDGMDAVIIDAHTLARRPMRDAVEDLLDTCEPFADELGCRTELAAAAELAADPGAARQRRHAAEHGLAEVLPWLAGEFTRVGPALKAVEHA
jgi:carboxylate-amine ligase